MQVRFWGVRGTVPSPGRDTIRYGGNTPCIDIRTTDGHTIIIDGGTGIRPLGNHLQEEFPSRLVATILLSHTHWDHIQGLPFFDPLSRRRNRFRLYGQRRVFRQLEDILAGQFLEPYLPFAYRSLPALMQVEELDSGDSFWVGDSVKVTVAALYHPGGCLGFRIEDSGRTVVYCSDTGHGRSGLNSDVLALAAGADLLVHDAHFPNSQQARAFADWGHSSWEEATQVAQEAGVGALALFHFAPGMSDGELDKIGEQARASFPGTFMARDQMKLELPAR